MTDEPGFPSEPKQNHNGRGTWRQDFLASLVVFMVALPLCIAIAKACKLPVEVGIITGIIGGIVVGFLAGSPLQISGPAAGLIVLVLDFVNSHAVTRPDGTIDYAPSYIALGVVVFLAGLIQLLMGIFQLGQWFRAVSPAVIMGMLAGIGVVIFAKQFHEMIDDTPSDKVIDNLMSIPDAVEKVILEINGPTARSHELAAFVGILTILCLIFWKPFAPKSLKMLPAALLGVVLATTISELAGLEVQRIRVNADLTQSIVWLTEDNLAAFIRQPATWKTAFTIAVIASAETLLCASAVDLMQNDVRTSYNRELLAQGAGNTICGLVGALPMTGVIVRSSANVEAGAKSRMSAILHGVWLLLFVMALPSLLGRIPSACLAAILVYTGYKLMDFKGGYALWKESKTEALIFIATTIGVVIFDLLTGVITGIVLSAAKLIHRFAFIEIRKVPNPSEKRIDLYLRGAATFLRLPQLAHALESVPQGWSLHVHLDELTFIDHACLQLFSSWEKQHEALGGHLSLDWDSLMARFDTTNHRTHQPGQAAPKQPTAVDSHGLPQR